MMIRRNGFKWDFLRFCRRFGFKPSLLPRGRRSKDIVPSAGVEFLETRKLLSSLPIFLADFDDGNGNPAGDGFLKDPGVNLWSVSSGHANTPNHSGPYSVYYGKGEGPNGGGNYDTGVRNTGTLTSSDIAIPFEGAMLSFKYLLEREPDAISIGADRVSVSVSTDGGGNFANLGIVFPTSTFGQFVSASADLSAFAGQTIRLQFSFDTVDAVDNNFEGWYVDDVLITGSDLDDQIGEDIPVAIGSTTAGEIDTHSDVDLYSFAASAGQTLSFDIDRPDTALDSWLRLFDAAGHEIAFSDDNAGPGEIHSPESYLQHTFTAGGTYYIGVSGFENKDYDIITGLGDINVGVTGAYTLTIQQTDPDDQISEATSLGVNGIVFGEIQRFDDVDMYAVTALAGQTLGFDVDKPAGSSIDSFLRLFDVNGGQLAQNNDAAAPGESLPTKESFLEFTFPSAGTYYVGVSGNGNIAYDPVTGDNDNFGLAGTYGLTVFNLSPVISSLGAAQTYTENDPGLVLSTGVTVTDLDSLNFDTGTLTASLTANGQSTDQLLVLSGGTGANQVTVDSGNNVVAVGGVTIGSIFGGTSGVPLTFTFNANATPATVQALLRRLAFDSTSDNPSTASRTVSVRMTDGDGHTSQTVQKTINVIAKNDSPSAISLSSTSVAENLPTGSVVATLTTTDPDNTSGFNYALVAPAGNPDAFSFHLDGNKLVTNESFDFETKNSYFFFIDVDDGSGGGNEFPVTIKVTNVNEAPAGTSKTITTLEDTAYTFTTADFGFTDTKDSPANTLLAVKITTLPTAGSLTNNGVTVTAGTLLAVANISAAKLKYTPVANSTTAASFTFQVQDNGGTASGGVNLDPSAKTMTMARTAVNDAPVKTAGTVANLTILEDAAATSLGLAGLTYGPGGGSDEASQSLTYKVTALPGNGKIFLADGTTVVLVNTAYTLPQLQGMKFKPNANVVGTGTFTFQVQDSGGTTNGGVNTLIQSLAITVTAVNDAPVKTAGTVANLTVVEDAVATSLGLAGLSYGPGGGADETSQTVTYKVTALPTSGKIFLADGTTVVLVNTAYTLSQLQGMKFKPNANVVGVGTFTFQVQDSGGTTNGGVNTLIQSLAITVTVVNDAPVKTAGTVANLTVLEDAVATSLGLAGLSYGPGGGADETPQTVTYKVTALPTSGKIFLADGTTAVLVNTAYTLPQLQGMRFKPNANVVGTGAFTFQVQDSGGTTNGGVNTLTQSLTITITSVNDAPVKTAGTVANLTVLEDALANSLGLAGLTYGPGGGSDEASQTVTYKVTTLPVSGKITLADGTTVVAANTAYTLPQLQGMKFKPNANVVGTGTFTFQVQDSGGTTNGGVNTLTQSLTITVTPINDAPTAASKTITTLEDTTYTFTTADFGFTDTKDSPANTLLAVKITTLPTAGSLTNNGIAVTAGVLLAVADISAGKLKYTPVANSTTAALFTFQVQDNGGTASGGVNLDPSAKTMTMARTAVNDVPVKTAGTVANLTVLEDAAATSLGLAGLTYGPGGGSDEASQSLTYKVTALPGNGKIILADGTTVVLVNTAYTLSQLQGMKFKPNANVIGTGAFTFQVQDSGVTTKAG